ncbi:MAG: hypothetical protein KBA18_04530 [Kiritimatiellae bacterium]|jgi:long-subunit fatty acid transport protein|nr:hypothetical protein [Kiritimatiellia bacterium]NLG01793.1 hypothetical protein [Lentisphaerota bacterium]
MRHSQQSGVATERGTGRAGGPAVRRVALALAAFWNAAQTVRAESFTIPTLAGDVNVPLVHVDRGGTVLRPSDPAAPAFSAPTIYSAPLPSGSGARALGLSGAFTAIADDATAASWNPAGLTQLERPEFSFVYRLKREQNRHWSGNEDYRVGDDDFYGNALNYLSAVMPFRIWERNAVFSLNFQEVFDFTQRFHADFSSRTSRSEHQSRSDTSHETITRHYDLANGYIDLTEYLTTHRTTSLFQQLSSSTLGRLRFEQEGSVQAVTPAFAVEVTPRFSLGIAVNIYQDALLGADAIRSQTRARYSGTLDSQSRVTDTHMTSGDWSYSGEYVSPTVSFPLDPDHGKVPEYSTTESLDDLTRLQYEGYYDVYDRIDDFRGINATLGALWNASEKLTLGFCLDLPWTARARQHRTVRAGVTVPDYPAADTAMRSRVAKDIEFDFPLYWAAGAAWHWNNRLTTSLDISQTQWSRYAFKAEGEPRINPLDGTPHGRHPIDDCWAVHTGTEYLWVLARTEIPFRAGLFWEQRPAVGQPDDYWGFSLGSGFSIGRGENKLIIDAAYIFSWGNDVMGTLVPGQQESLGTDVRRHDLYVSCIYHF